MYGSMKAHLREELDAIERDGLFKKERVITSVQDAVIRLDDGSEVLNFCANNYLGLSSHPRVVDAAKRAIDERGFGMSSVRFICGTQDIHKDLEKAIADFHHTEDTILYAAAFDANGGVFEPLLTAEDAIISDALNHASIIDGVRLCKAARYRFANNDMEDLEKQLQTANEAGHRFKVIVTDGVFSMDGYVAQIGRICDLADQYDALVMVDECHATGFIGPGGRGTPALHGVEDRVDIVTSTLGKALGGGMGGFVAARQPLIDLLRQRARPYLFSNALAPALVGGAIEGLRLIAEGDDLRNRLEANAARFRSAMTDAGFTLTGEGHPIIPVMLGDADLAGRFAVRLLAEGVYATAFSFPVVPNGTARIRTQMNADHTDADLDVAVAAFTKVGQELGVVS